MLRGVEQDPAAQAIGPVALPKWTARAHRAWTPLAARAPPASPVLGPRQAPGSSGIKIPPTAWIPPFRVKVLECLREVFPGSMALPPQVQELNPPPLCGLRARSLSLWDYCPVFTHALTTPFSGSLQRASGPLLEARLGLLCSCSQLCSPKCRDIPALLGRGPRKPGPHTSGLSTGVRFCREGPWFCCVASSDIHRRHSL